VCLATNCSRERRRKCGHGVVEAAVDSVAEAVDLAIEDMAGLTPDRDTVRRRSYARVRLIMD
jgi:hypothetical protein